MISCKGLPALGMQITVASFHARGKSRSLITAVEIKVEIIGKHFQNFITIVIRTEDTSSDVAKGKFIRVAVQVTACEEIRWC